MPTYQYHCPSCGHDFEEFQSMSEDPISKCPMCEKEPRRIISGGAGFIFKGSGFYQTDYRSSGYKADAKKDTPSAASSSDSDSSKKKSDSKPSTDKKK